MSRYTLSHLETLEAESIHIMREVAAEFDNPVMLYSIGKDSSVMVDLARKAFHPAKIPFPLLHVDTGMKFAQMYEFRDEFAQRIGAKLIVHRNEEAISKGINPHTNGTQKCCAELKTQALLTAIREGGFDAAFGGARRDEERSRAKERIYSFRDSFGQWEPKKQRPELWNIFNGRHDKGESIRVFPLSNWTELDIWFYIYKEKIPIVPMYFASEREVIEREGQLIPVGEGLSSPGDEKVEKVMCRFRTLGCYPCTGAVRSDAQDLEQIIAEVMAARQSERTTRIIDHDTDGSMEIKKREGYF